MTRERERERERSASLDVFAGKAHVGRAGLQRDSQTATGLTQARANGSCPALAATI